jgi:RNA polymerase sigma factor (sigma-70 family)
MPGTTEREEMLHASSAPTDELQDGQPARLELFRRGDPATLAQVYWSHVDRIEKIIRWQMILWRRNQASRSAYGLGVEDLVQDTFERAFSRRARLAYDGKRNYSPYLSTIARNVLADALRALRGNLIVDSAAHLEDCTYDTSRRDGPEWAEPGAMTIVTSYIGRLPPELAAVHHQRYVVGTSQESAARVLNLTRQRLRTLERKLRSGLTRELERAGISWKGSP